VKRLWIALFLILAATAAAEDEYVFSAGKALTTVGENIDFVLLSKLPEKYGDHFLWMRRGGKSYVVRDKTALVQAGEIVKPQRELGANRAGISQRQAAISGELLKYGREQALLGAELAKLSPVADEAKVTELQSKMRVVSAKLRELSAQQESLNRELHDLVEAQEKLQPGLMKALGAFADDAIAKGVATAE